MANYNVRITFQGNDKASGILGRIGSALGGIGKIAGGILGANLFMGIGHQIGNMSKQVFEAVASYEQLEFTMESLIAREISHGQVVETTSRAYVQALTQQKNSWMGLNDILKDEQINLRNMEMEYRNLTSTTQMTVAQNLEWQAKLQSQRDLIAEISGGMSTLTLWTNRLADAQKGEATIGAMSMEKAYLQAGEEAKELLKWTQNLAIYSPFDMKTVADTLRMGMAYGFNKEMAQRLTEATVNYTAATGQAGDVSERIARALGQVQAKGRLMGEEIRQLTDASIPVVQILADAFGKTTKEVTDMVRKGLVPADVAVDAIVASMEEFDGVARRQFETWRGLSNALGDIKDLGMQRVFDGIFEAFKPFVAEWVDFMATEGLEKLEQFGVTAGQNLVWIFESLGNAIAFIKTGDFTGGIFNFSEDHPVIVGFIALRDTLIDVKVKGIELKDELAPLTEYLDELAVLAGSLAVLSQVAPGMTALGAAIRGIGPMLGGVLSALGGPWVILLAGAITALYFAWTNNFMGIRDTMTDFWYNTLEPFILTIVPWFQETLPVVLEVFRGIWESVVTSAGNVFDWFKGIVDSVWAVIGPIWYELVDVLDTIVRPALEGVASTVSTVFQTAWTILSDVFNAVVKPALDFVWDLIENYLWPVLQLIGDYINNTWKPLWEAIGNLFNAVIKVAIQAIYFSIKWLLQKAVEKMTEKLEDWKAKWELLRILWETYITPALDKIHEWLDEKLQPVLSFYTDTLLPGIEKGFAAINTIVELLIGWIQKAIEWLEKLDIPGAFQQHSPSPFEQSIMDIITQLQYLNALPWLPKMRSIDFQSMTSDINQMSSGLAPAMAGLVGVGSSGNIEEPLFGNPTSSNKEVHYHIQTTLNEDELVALLERIQRQEGNF